MVLGRRVAYTLRRLVVLLALYRCVMGQYINWFVPSSENERVFEETGRLYFIENNTVIRRELELSDIAMDTHLISSLRVTESPFVLYTLNSTSTNQNVVRAANFTGFQRDDTVHSFTDTGEVEGSAVITVLFHISMSISTKPDLKSLEGTEIRLRGTKHCNRTEMDNSGSDNGGFNASVFYIAIGCVGGLIAVVVMVTVLYHCIMLGTWMNKHRDETEDLNNLNLEDVIPSSSSSSTHPVVTVLNTPSIISQVHIPTLTQSPRNSATLYPPTTISTSVKSLLSFKDLMVDRKRIAIGQVLKEGVFGVVYDGYLANAEDEVEGATPVIIKTVKDNTPEIVVKSLLEGGSAVRPVLHRHILPLIATHVSDSEMPMLLYPKTALGTLKALLLKAREPKRGGMMLTTQDLVTMCAQISRGMYHLTRKGVIHRDLAARNIYVHENFHIRIGDRGLSWDLFSEEYSRQSDGEMCPIKWQAAETIREKKYSHYSDVWSFGVVLWEVMTLGRMPYEDVPAEDMLTVLTSGQRLAQPKNCPDDLFVLMGWCWALTATDRPRFSHLTLRLKEFHERVSAYV